MSDLVERLRDRWEYPMQAADLGDEAADYIEAQDREIERLRAEVAEDDEGREQAAALIVKQAEVIKELRSAITTARRSGAEAMRERAAGWCDDARNGEAELAAYAVRTEDKAAYHIHKWLENEYMLIAAAIRALPLEDGE